MVASAHGQGGGGCCFFTMIGGGVHISESRQIRYKGVPNRAGIWQSIWVRQALLKSRIDEKDNSMNKLIGLASCTALAMMLGCTSTASPPPATTPDGLELVSSDKHSAVYIKPMRSSRSTKPLALCRVKWRFARTGSATTTRAPQHQPAGQTARHRPHQDRPRRGEHNVLHQCIDRGAGLQPRNGVAAR